MRADVHVTTRRRLLGWLQSLPVAIGEGEIEAIWLFGSEGGVRA